MQSFKLEKYPGLSQLEGDTFEKGGNHLEQICVVGPLTARLLLNYAQISPNYIVVDQKRNFGCKIELAFDCDFLFRSLILFLVMVKVIFLVFLRVAQIVRF